MAFNTSRSLFLQEISKHSDGMGVAREQSPERVRRKAIHVKEEKSKTTTELHVHCTALKVDI